MFTSMCWLNLYEFFVKNFPARNDFHWIFAAAEWLLLCIFHEFLFNIIYSMAFFSFVVYFHLFMHIRLMIVTFCCVLWILRLFLFLAYICVLTLLFWLQKCLLTNFLNATASLQRLDFLNIFKRVFSSIFLFVYLFDIYSGGFLSYFFRGFAMHYTNWMLLIAAVRQCGEYMSMCIWDVFARLPQCLHLMSQTVIDGTLKSIQIT